MWASQFFYPQSVTVMEVVPMKRPTFIKSPECETESDNQLKKDHIQCSDWTKD